MGRHGQAQFVAPTGSLNDREKLDIMDATIAPKTPPKNHWIDKPIKYIEIPIHRCHSS
jgi:hypothetical protein